MNESRPLPENRCQNLRATADDLEKIASATLQHHALRNRLDEVVGADAFELLLRAGTDLRIYASRLRPGRH